VLHEAPSSFLLLDIESSLYQPQLDPTFLPDFAFDFSIQTTTTTCLPFPDPLASNPGSLGSSPFEADLEADLDCSWPDLGSMQVSHLDFSNHHFPSQPSGSDTFHHHNHQPTHQGDHHLGLNLFSSPDLDSLTHLTPSSFGGPSHTPGSSYGHTQITTSSGSSPSAGHDSASYPGLTLPKKPKRGRPPASEAARRSASPDPDTVVKRQRNNVAAKKYRQKKIDRIQELEDVVDEVKRERDELKIRLARQEAETEALREMLKMKMGGGGA